MNNDQRLEILNELTLDERKRVESLREEYRTLPALVRNAISIHAWGVTLLKLVRLADNATIRASWDSVVKDVEEMTKRALRQGLGDTLCFWTAVFSVYGERFEEQYAKRISEIQEAAVNATRNHLIPSITLLKDFSRRKSTCGRRITDYWFGSLPYDEQEAVLTTLEKGADISFIDQLLTAMRDSSKPDAPPEFQISIAIQKIADAGELHIEEGLREALHFLDVKYNDERYYSRYTRHRQIKLLNTKLEPHESVLADLVSEWSERKTGENKISLRELAQSEGLQADELYHYQERQKYQRKKRRN